MHAKYLAAGLILLVGCVRASDPPTADPEPPVRMIESKGSRLCPGMADEPLVVDWPAKQRAALERALSTGVAAVRVSCPFVSVVEDCTSLGTSYSYESTPLTRTTLHLDRGGLLSANLPYEAVVEPEAIDVAFASLGRFYQGRKVARDDLMGDGCEHATHTVQAAWIGAYRVSEGTRGKQRSFDEIYGVGSNDLGAEADERLRRQDGALPSCEHMETTHRLPGRCRAPFRIALAALEPPPYRWVNPVKVSVPDWREFFPVRPSASRRDAYDSRVWYPQHGRGPLLATASSRKLLIGLTWAMRSKEVDIVALDPNTLAEVWTEQGFSVHWGSPVAHLRVVADRVVLSDDHGDVHILDALTGDEVRVVRFRGRVGAMCTPGDGSRRLFVVPQEGTTADAQALDVDTGVLSPAPKTAHCSWAPKSGYETRLAAVDDGVVKRAREKRFRAGGTLEEGDFRVVVGTVSLRSREEVFAVAWDAMSKQIGWEGRLAAPDDVPIAEGYGVGKTAISNGRLFHVYQSGIGRPVHRLVARSPRTGALLYSIDVAAGDRALSSLTFIDDSVYLVIGQELVVVDAATGKKRHHLHHL